MHVLRSLVNLWRFETDPLPKPSEHRAVAFPYGRGAQRSGCCFAHESFGTGDSA